MQFDDEAAEWVTRKMSAMQYVLEIALANQFGADGCENLGKRAVAHAKAVPPNLPAGAGPHDVTHLQRQAIAIADEVAHIFRNAAQRARRPGDA